MDRQQVMRLLGQFGDDVFRLAMSYLGNRQDAEDICQNVFLKALDTRCAPLPGKEKAWLLTCAANACRNHLKSFWRRNRDEYCENAVCTSDADREIAEAVGCLRPKDRMIIHLYYYEGYAQDEIAQILGISRTAVQTRMDRARKRLKEVLEKYE